MVLSLSITAILSHDSININSPCQKRQKLISLNLISYIVYEILNSEACPSFEWRRQGTGARSPSILCQVIC